MRLACVMLSVALLLADTPKLPPLYQSLVDLAHASPPEFAADALLRLVESGKLADRDTKKDLVEQAFRLAAMAKFPVRMHGVAGTMVDTRSGFLSRAHDLKLDALSLQSRAVRDMLPLNAAKARELFLEITRPALPALSCDDPLVYDVGDYYQSLGAVFHGAFSAEEHKKEEDLNFLLDYLGQITSAAQLAPAARLIKSAGVSAPQREILWNKFNGLLESLQADSRGYAAALEDIRREIGSESQASFEKFQQKTTGCPDDARPGVNLELSKGTVHAGSTPVVQHYWESAQAKRLLQDGLRLRYTSDGKLIPEASRNSREWQQQLADYMTEIAEWSADQEKSEADYYHQKCLVYEALVELIPRGPQRDQTIEAYMDFISTSNLQQQSPVEWFLHANSMLERVRSTNSGEPDKILEAFQSSRNPMLVLYAAEERIFGSQVPSWVTNSR